MTRNERRKLASILALALLAGCGFETDAELRGSANLLDGDDAGMGECPTPLEWFTGEGQALILSQGTECACDALGVPHDECIEAVCAEAPPELIAVDFCSEPIGVDAGFPMEPPPMEPPTPAPPPSPAPDPFPLPPPLPPGESCFDGPSSFTPQCDLCAAQLCPLERLNCDGDCLGLISCVVDQCAGDGGDLACITSECADCIGAATPATELANCIQAECPAECELSPPTAPGCAVATGHFIPELQEIIDFEGGCVCDLIGLPNDGSCAEEVCAFFAPSDFIEGRCPFEDPGPVPCEVPSDAFIEGVMSDDLCVCDILEAEPGTCGQRVCNEVPPEFFPGGVCPFGCEVSPEDFIAGVFEPDQCPCDFLTEGACRSCDSWPIFVFPDRDCPFCEVSADDFKPGLFAEDECPCDFVQAGECRNCGAWQDFVFPGNECPFDPEPLCEVDFDPGLPPDFPFPFPGDPESDCICDRLGAAEGQCAQLVCSLFFPFGDCPFIDPPDPVDAQGSLIQTNPGALQGLDMFAVFDALASNAGSDVPATRLYQELIDSYASADNGRLPDAIHCGDETTDGAPSLNGFRIDCDRLETEQFDNIRAWFPIAAVNRIDLAPEDGAHCGQQRLILANDLPIGNGRMFVIFEPVIPNPSPECGVAACQPIAEFWANLDSIPDAEIRAEELRRAFLGGHLLLEEAGFGPFLSADAVSFGTGQIRTNNFNDFFWTLREFKLFDGGTDVSIVPVPTADAPSGLMWNDLIDHPAGDECRASMLDAIDDLLVDPAVMAFPIASVCNDAESRNDFSQSYADQLLSGSGELFDRIQERIAGTGLTPVDVANRAQLAGSCIGCHEEANGAFLGNGESAGFSNGFVHVDEQFLEPCGNGESCFATSQMLDEVFLPQRALVMEELLFGPSCGGDGPDDDAGVGFPPDMDGGVDTGGTGGTGGSAPLPGFPPLPGTDTGSAGSGSVGPIDGSGFILPSGEPDVDALLEAEEAQRQGWSDHTLGGQPSSVTH